MGHALKTERLANFMQNQLADYIIRYCDPVSEVAEEYLSRKGQTLDDYHEYIKQPGNMGDKLALHIMACMANISTIVVTKTGVWSTFDGDVSNAELVLVYLGKSVFQDTVPISYDSPLVISIQYAGNILDWKRNKHIIAKSLVIH